MAVKVVAVSGGVDSVVLLHKLLGVGDKLVVAHVDHGIRDDSGDDARFVEGLAKLYGLEFEDLKLSLGPNASEDLARQKRYDFLLDVAKRHNGILVTAHHGDDLVETVVINLRRGTGWRGLAVMNRGNVERPLVGLSKDQIYEYALLNNLEYVEDKTNRDLRYLRNKIRSQLKSRLNDSMRAEFLELRNHQIALRGQIQVEVEGLNEALFSSRHFFTQVPSEVALEILGCVMYGAAGVRPVKAQLESALIAIKTAKTGSVTHVGNGILLRFTSRVFSVEMLS